MLMAVVVVWPVLRSPIGFSIIHSQAMFQRRPPAPAGSDFHVSVGLGEGPRRLSKEEMVWPVAQGGIISPECLQQSRL